MIDVQQLTKCYGRVRALSDVSFTVPRGQTVALWGHNGAGKSTTLQCLLGIIRFQGRIQVQGEDVARQPRAARRLMGYVPQDMRYHDMTARQVAEFFASLRKVPIPQVVAGLAEVGLAEHLHKQVRALSGGMRQRLALALALLGDPPVLLLDEPTANLDAAARQELGQLLLRQRQAGKTIVFASHRPDEIQELAGSVLYLDGGHLVQQLRPADLLRQLGGSGWLRVRVPAGAMDAAVAELNRRGFVARPNHVDVLVQVEPGRKAAPVGALAQAGFAVLDFDLEGAPWTSPH